MEVIGKIIVDLGEQSGQSKAGNLWKKHEYVLETAETYPRKIHFDFFGDRADQFKLQLGQNIRLSFDIESREYNGRWYTSIKGWKAEDADAQAAAPVGYGAPATAATAPAAPAAAATTAPGAVPPPPIPNASTEEDLPF